MKTKFIGLLTDFGSKDPFVASMKGIIFSKNPDVKIIDISHEIPPQNIDLAGFYLMTSLRYMPKTTLIVCVVDPEVGTSRNILWAKTANYQLICPDNGIVGQLEEVEPIKEMRILSNAGLFLRTVSSTFHGRDIMSPAAAMISAGFPEKKIGPKIDDYLKNSFPKPQKKGDTVSGKVIAIDHFGNVITNIKNRCLRPDSILTISGKTISGVNSSYASVKENKPVALAGSLGFLEFAVRNSNFAEKYSVKIGDKVAVTAK